MKPTADIGASRVRNDLFDPCLGLTRGRPLWVEATWHLCKSLFFLTPVPFPSALKRGILRWFGARIGIGVVIKPRVNIHLPWKLTVGDWSWIGEEACLLNLEPISIGSHCCVSQRAFLCTGNHDYTVSSMPYRNQPIRVGDGAWVGAQAFVAPGVSVGRETVVAAGSVVTRDLPAGCVCSGNPCLPVRRRWKETRDVRPGESLPPTTDESGAPPR